VISEGGKGREANRSIEWTVDPNQLKMHDKMELLRRFSVGLPVERQPYSLIAVEGFRDIVSSHDGPQILAEALAYTVSESDKFCVANQFTYRYPGSEKD